MSVAKGCETPGRGVVVGGAISRSIDTRLAVVALEAAIASRQPRE